MSEKEVLDKWAILQSCKVNDIVFDYKDWEDYCKKSGYFTGHESYPFPKEKVEELILFCIKSINNQSNKHIWIKEVQGK